MQKVEDTINALCDTIIREAQRPDERPNMRELAKATEALASLIKANTEAMSAETATRLAEHWKGEII